MGKASLVANELLNFYTRWFQFTPHKDSVSSRCSKMRARNRLRRSPFVSHRRARSPTLMPRGR